MHTVFAFSSDRDRRLARNVALAQGLRNSQPGGAIRAPDGTTCACGERASLLHAPSTMKLWPGVQKLFQFYRPSFLPKLDAGAAFRSRSEQGEELGGGFWGSEGSTELEKMREGTLKWAVDTGGFLVAGNCASVEQADAPKEEVKQKFVPSKAEKKLSEVPVQQHERKEDLKAKTPSVAAPWRKVVWKAVDAKDEAPWVAEVKRTESAPEPKAEALAAKAWSWKTPWATPKDIEDEVPETKKRYVPPQPRAVESKSTTVWRPVETPKEEVKEKVVEPKQEAKVWRPVETPKEEVKAKVVEQKQEAKVWRPVETPKEEVKAKVVEPKQEAKVWRPVAWLSCFSDTVVEKDRDREGWQDAKF
eukprot:Skav217135  [mRNA]  locus=scaffold1539:16729:31796:- [translate_table: standard]